MSFKDHDYIRTVENLFFCVVGYTHPSDRIISYLKYIPNLHGKWGKENRRFKRALPRYTIPSLAETFKLLRMKYPQYLFNSHVMNIKMSAVPLNRVKQHYHSEEGLRHLIETTSKLDSLQQDVLKLVSLLSRESDIPVNFFGVTGSVLINIHKLEFSDIDLTIHGLENSRLLKNTVLSLYKKKGAPLRRFSGKILRKWCENKSALYPITMEEAEKFYERKWNMGLYKNKPFSIHPVKLNEEIKVKYGDRVFIPYGIVEAKGIVTDTKDGPFLPSTYKVEKFTVTSGPQVTDIREVVTYEGLYADLFKVGDKIFVRGKLEKVLDKRAGEEYHRVLIGSMEAAGLDFIKLN